MVKTDVVKEPVEKVTHKKIMKAMHKMKSGKATESVIERQIRTLISLNGMHFRLMPGKGTVDAIFIVRRMPKEYLNKEMNCICVLLAWKRHLIDFS